MLTRYVCPRCRQGAIFKGRLPHLAIHERCPVCGLKYEREQGYFMKFLARIIPLAVLSLVFMRPAPAQPASEASGHWEGAIQVPDGHLKIEVELAKNEKALWIGRISIPAMRGSHRAATPAMDRGTPPVNSATNRTQTSFFVSVSGGPSP
jgi:hypothetical protein